MKNRMNNHIIKPKSKEQLQTLHDPSILQTLNSQSHTSSLEQSNFNNDKKLIFSSLYDS